MVSGTALNSMRAAKCTVPRHRFTDYPVWVCVSERERGGGSECVCLCVCLCAYQVNVTACKESPCAASARHTSSIDGITERKKNTRGRKRATFVENNRLVCRTRWVCHYNPFQASVEWVFSSRVRVLRLNFTESYRKQYRFVCFFHPLENLTVRVRRVTLNPG